jgi:hypothetical protein
MVGNGSLMKSCCLCCRKQKIQENGEETLSRSSSSHDDDSFESGILPALGVSISSAKLINNKYVISPYNPYYR